MEMNVRIKMGDLDRIVWTHFVNGIKVKRTADGTGIEVSLLERASYPFILTIDTDEKANEIRNPGVK